MAAVSHAGKWGDLLPRVVSGLSMIGVALVAIWYGGVLFGALVVIVCGLMVWELMRMVAPAARSLAWQMALIAGVAVVLVQIVPIIFVVPLLAAPALVVASQVQTVRKTAAAYTLLVTFAGFALVHLREDAGIGWVLWLAVLVVISDVMGYFAGKSLGGPKFWPAISPKKTWSGTVAGWIGAGCVGAIFGIGSGIWGAVVVASVVLAFAAQMGDIAESAIKRRMGVKDSSNLIPGHGGVLDRFDGLIAAAAMYLLLSQILAFPIRMPL